MFTVTKKSASSNLINDINEVITPVVGDINKWVKPTDKILLKPNFNTADPPPASTCVDFLSAVIQVFQKANPKELLVGESCTYFLNTERVCKTKGVQDLVSEYGVTFVNFEKHPFISKKVEGGKYFKKVSMSKIIDEVDKVILLPCLKTHRLAAFTGAIKIAIGFQKPRQRGVLHLNHLQERVSEVASVFTPDLVIMDGRKCFVTRGPEDGQIETPNIVMASDDRVAIDVEGINIINSYKAENLLTEDAWDLPQIKQAVELGIGSSSKNDYELAEI